MDSSKIEYYDKWVLSGVVILLTAVFTILGGNLSKIKIEIVAINFLYTLSAVLLLRGLIHLLDIYYPWTKNLYARFAIQTFGTLVLYFGIQTIILFYLETSNQITSGAIFGTYFAGTLALLMINSLYLSLFIRHKAIVSLTEKDNQGFIGGRLGSKRLSVTQSDLRYIFIDNTLIRAIDKEGRTIILNDNLTDLEKDLNPNQFFRTNRQSIVARQIIREVVYNSNKSCTLKLMGIKEEITVSRHKAPKFKKWLKKLNDINET